MYNWSTARVQLITWTLIKVVIYIYSVIGQIDMKVEIGISTFMSVCPSDGATVNNT
jgi:hypothetical protein